VPAALALCAAASVSGCFLFHGLGGDPAPGRADAGRARIDAGAFMPPPPPDLDAGTLPPECGPAAPRFACTDRGNGAVPVGVAYDLPIFLGGLDECHCGERLACTGAVVGPGQLDLRSAVCIDSLCEACLPYVSGTCRLPPLDEGTWRVTVNGREAFELTASDAIPGEGPIERCVTVADAGAVCEATWAPRPEDISQICLPFEMPAGVPVPVEVTDFCLGCGSTVGSCDVVRTANFIEVRPTTLPPACDVDCPAECALDESTCFIGPLEPGTYFVSYPGVSESVTLTVAEGLAPSAGRGCASVPED